jgi:hypothetical protein
MHHKRLMINEWKVFDYGIEVQAKMDFATTTLMQYSGRREQRRMTSKPPSPVRHDCLRTDWHRNGALPSQAIAALPPLRHRRCC